LSDLNQKWNVDFDIIGLVLHKDQRGILFEAFRLESQEIPSGGQVYVYSVEPGMRRGDHYHENKKEWFTCVHGNVRVFLKTQAGKTEAFDMSADEPKMVFVGGGTAHAVENFSSEPAIIIAYASKEFDPDEPDTVMSDAGH
jgi:dTDP-4-dehydrorhamnose 3,5-epimerase-like enzyme